MYKIYSYTSTNSSNNKMMKAKIVSIVVIFHMTLLNMVNAQRPVYQDANQPIEKRIESALSLMTLEEKVAMCHAQS